MPLFRRRKTDEKVVPMKLDAKALHTIALQLEKARLGDYVAMMSRPGRSIYLNFIAGIARGAGMAVGTVLVGGLIILLAVQGLKMAFRHAGGVPWVGQEVKEAVGFVLQAAHEKASDMDGN
jgi:hypothetical protein